MTYTEVSTYGYITGDALEAFTGIDYSTINATLFTEANVMGKVTMAEMLINGYLGVTGAQTVTDGITMATTIIAAKLMQYNMTELGYATEGQEGNDLIGMSTHSILRLFLGYDAGVDAIPMSGAND